MNDSSVSMTSRFDISILSFDDVNMQSDSILRRMELVEERLSSHENELGNLGVICRRTEGVMIALQSRQDELDTKVLADPVAAGSNYDVGPNRSMDIQRRSANLCARSLSLQSFHQPNIHPEKNSRPSLASTA